MSTSGSTRSRAPGRWPGWSGAGVRLRRPARGGTGLGPAALLGELGMLGPGCHIAHGVYLDADDRALLRARGTAVALCPRSNRTLGLEGPDVAALLTEGNLVAVGTDSLASSPSLDVLADVAALRDLAVRQGYRAADLDRRLIEAATLGGAHAMGIEGVSPPADLPISRSSTSRRGRSRIAL
ncbi:amidohydrolase family protein [Streptosporangium lutulentum]